MILVMLGLNYKKTHVFDYFFFIFVYYFLEIIGAGEAVNKSAASATSLDYIKFQAVIKSTASAASLCGGSGSG